MYYNCHTPQDFMDSIKKWLSVLMDNYKVPYICTPPTPHPHTHFSPPTHTQVLLYNGQLDIVVGPTLTERMLQVLDWSGKEEYLKADKMVCSTVRPTELYSLCVLVLGVYYCQLCVQWQRNHLWRTRRGFAIIQRRALLGAGLIVIHCWMIAWDMAVWRSP